MYQSSGTSASEPISFTPWLKKALKYVSGYINVANIIGLIAAIAVLLCLLALPASGYWNIRLPLYLLIVLWTILRPRAALYLMPIAVPWGSLDPANMGGLHLADILAALLAAGWLISFALRQHAAPDTIVSGPLERDQRAVPRYLVLAMLALLCAMLASMTVTNSFSLSLKELVKWVEVLVIVLLGSQYLRTRRQIWLLVIIICLAAVSQAIFGYIQYFFNLGPTAFIRDTSLRVYGTFDQPNPYAGYINMALSITLALCLLGRGLRIRVLSGITTICLLGVEVLSQSKGGWLALIAAMLLIVIVGLPRIHLLVRGTLVVALSLLGSYLTGLIPERLLTPIWEKAGFLHISFTEPTNDSFANSERLAHWLAGLRMFLDHPFLGVGIGNYAVAYPQYAPGRFIQPLGHAHNYYINIAAEAGIFGLLALLFLLVAIFLAGSNSYRHVQRRWQDTLAHQLKRTVSVTAVERLYQQVQERMLVNDRALIVGILASLLSVCVHNIVDDLYVHSMTNLFALLIIMLIRLGIVAQQQETVLREANKQ